MMDLDEQARSLEKLQFELQAAGFGTQQVAEPTSVHLAVWHPSTPSRRATVTAEYDDEPIYRSSFELSGSRATRTYEVRGYIIAVLGDPHEH